LEEIVDFKIENAVAGKTCGPPAANCPLPTCEVRGMRSTNRFLFVFVYQGGSTIFFQKNGF